MAEAEIIALKEALINQAQFIRELSDELDEERKAAASGVDEALSMIYRLQQGRALQKMEAVQFRRFAEAKFLHTEELLELLKKSMLEKEEEISTLKFQLQSYRQNMQRYGSSDTNVEEINVPNIRSDTCESSKKKSEQRIRFFSKKSTIEEVTFDSNKPKRIVSDSASEPDMRIDNLCVRDDTGDCSVSLQLNSERLFESNSGCTQINSQCGSSSCLVGGASQPSSIQDIYEVPKNGQDISDSCDATMEAKIKTYPETLFNDLSYKTPIFMPNDWKYSTLEDGVSINSLQSDFEQLKRRVTKIENDQKIMREEDSKRNMEQLNLLRGIHEQLKAIQPQRKAPNNKKVSKQDEILLASIAEAVMLFSL